MYLLYVSVSSLVKWRKLNYRVIMLIKEKLHVKPLEECQIYGDLLNKC